jgi:O-antigen/teichoic acid export membrane protein
VRNVSSAGAFWGLGVGGLVASCALLGYFFWRKRWL